MSGYIRPNIFTIEPGQPFLATLVEALCNGVLVPNFKFDGEPLSLARATIYVPTQRAARELRSVFLDHLGNTSVLLPRIKTLGEFDEDAALFESDAQTFVKALPPIDPLERQLMLGRMIAGWTKHLADHLRHYFDGEEFTTPVSTADAFWMARDLAELLDQLQTEDLSFDDIEAAAEAETSDWWQVTLSFLKIIKSEWPHVLSERRRVDPAMHRNMMLRGEAARLAASQPTSPIIVAGSTGTIPATADLIATIAKLPVGAVVLPGYDLTMGEQTRNILAEPDDLASAIGHPQYGMHQLVLKMGASGLIDVLGKPLNEALASRKKWVAAALEPASQTQNWNAVRNGLRGDAFENVALLVAASEREEAAGIAAAMREVIADPKATTALVTPDRMLARRVVTELARYGIQANDSGGSPFDLSAHGMLLSFTLKNAFDTQKDAASLLALLKNKLAQIGVDRKTHEESLVWLEMLILRGGVDRLDIANFSAFAARQLDAWADKNLYA
ncbi:MAG: double-strand break repair protein AddB [Ahrensia sp.]|nr:double-strand break repair protein AddB [Ahrensia sp.]